MQGHEYVSEEEGVVDFLLNTRQDCGRLVCRVEVKSRCLTYDSDIFVLVEDRVIGLSSSQHESCLQYLEALHTGIFALCQT
jgi:hypothetical protein